MLRSIIVEDEVASQEALVNYLADYCPQVQLVALASNIAEGKAAIEQHQPDLVFLDVEMPFGNGFDLLASLDDIRFQTIFVTAFSHYAIRAIQYSAANYILKPIAIEELVAAVEKAELAATAKEQISPTRVLLENIHITQKQRTKIVLPVLEGLEIIRAEAIIHCEAQDNFTLFTLTDGETRLICRTLKHYQSILEPLGFVRIHKSHLVNLEHITKYTKGKGGYVTLSNQRELPVAASRKSELLAQLGQ
ncbi:MAG TPA: DNA-binding response regulator [Cytophagales bacterium]|nr:DNA-binding response regulator [Cytophagales bacterium]